MDTLYKNLSIPNVVNIFRKGVHFCYELMLQPRSSNEDNQRRELILNILLTGFIVFLACLDIVVYYNTFFSGYPYKGISFIRFSEILLIFSLLLFLSRRGYFILSAYIFTFAFLISIVYGSYRWGVGLPAGLLSYCLLISLSSVLVSTRYSVVMTMLIVGVVVSLGFREAHAGVLPYWRFQPILITDSIQYVTLLLLTTGISSLANRETEKSLIRARKSEKALKEKNESLEVIIEERTKELRAAQAEKVSHLYRFAEFGRLSSGFFHDLVSPLTVVAASVDRFASEVSPTTKELRTHVERAVNASRKMERFMTTVKKQMSVQEFEQEFVVNDEIEEVLTLFNYKSLQYKIDIDFQADEKIKLYGNPIKFQQVITNLLSNAIDACKDETIPQARKKITLRLIKKKDTVKIMVIDFGCGIEKGLIPKIFDPFFTTKMNYNGMGLGLSTTQQVVQNDFSGLIKVESETNQGTVFTVYIPIKEDAK